MNKGFFICRLQEKFGVVNFKGKIIVPFIYDNIEYCHNGFIVSSGSRLGLIDLDGLLTIQPVNKRLDHEVDRIFSIVYDDNQQAIINSHGKFLIKPDSILTNGNLVSYQFYQLDNGTIFCNNLINREFLKSYVIYPNDSVLVLNEMLLTGRYCDGFLEFVYKWDYNNGKQVYGWLDSSGVVYLKPESSFRHESYIRVNRYIKYKQDIFTNNPNSISGLWTDYDFKNLDFNDEFLNAFGYYLCESKTNNLDKSYIINKYGDVIFSNIEVLEIPVAKDNYNEPGFLTYREAFLLNSETPGIPIFLYDKSAWGLLGKDGKFVLNPIHRSISWGIKGIVSYSDSLNNLYIFNNNVGQHFKLNILIERVESFNGNYGIVRLKNGFYDIINYRGELCDHPIEFGFVDSVVNNIGIVKTIYDSIFMVNYHGNIFNYGVKEISALSKLYAKVVLNRFFGIISDEKILVPSNYSDVRALESKFVLFRQNEYWGVMDSSLRVVVPTVMEQGAIEKFSSLLNVRAHLYKDFANDLMADLNRNFEFVKELSNGYFIVRLSGKFGIVDKMGKLIYPFIYEQIDDFSFGLVALVKNGFVGYGDEAGQIRIPFKYFFVSCIRNLQEFRFGRYYAIVNEGIIDRSGDFIEEYKGINSFSIFSRALNSYILSKPDMKVTIFICDTNVLIRESREYIIKSINADAYQVFFEGSKICILSPDNEVLLSISVDKVAGIQEFGGSWFFLRMNTPEKNTLSFFNTQSLKEIKLRGSYADVIGTTLLSVRDERGFYLVNSYGKRINNVYYDFISTWSENGLYITKRGNLFGLIDSLGKELLLPAYQSIKVINIQVLAVKNNNLWQLYSIKDKVAYGMKYDVLEIERVKDKLSVKKNGKWGVIDLKGKMLLDYKYDFVQAIWDDKYIIGSIILNKKLD